MCDMDRLGRNEFIGEVRVALKKLKEGESKRYNMGLERIAQVHIVCDVFTHISNGFLWTYRIYQDVSYFHSACLPVGYQVSISNAVL